MTERGQVKARQYTTVQRLIAAQVTAFLIIGPDLIGYYQNYRKNTGTAVFYLLSPIRDIPIGEKNNAKNYTLDAFLIGRPCIDEITISGGLLHLRTCSK